MWGPRFWNRSVRAWSIRVGPPSFQILSQTDDQFECGAALKFQSSCRSKFWKFAIGERLAANVGEFDEGMVVGDEEYGG